jgi:hypothetical protein
LTPELESQLIDAIAGAFKNEKFDVTSIRIRAAHDPALSAAIGAAIPNCRYRSGWCRDQPLRRLLEQVAEKHFATDTAGWWSVQRDG